MGTFVLGVLVGWLAEWLFFTFWVKRDSNSGSSDCEGLRVELDAKNKEIATLKSASSATTNKAASVGSSSSTAAKQSTTTRAKKAPAKKASAKKAPAKKATTVKKPAPKKTTPKKAAVNPAKKKSTVKKASPAKKTSGDDLTKLSGIGPSMAATMDELGITSYKKLAAMDDDILRDMLEASGVRLNNNKDAMDTWNEQATLADKGDLAGLKKLQDDLK